MILDVAILTILVLMIAKGRRKGLVYIIFRILGWLAGIAAGLIFALPLSAFLSQNFEESIGCVLSFLIITMIVRFLIRLFVKPANRRAGLGLITGADRFLGMVAGGINGLLIIFLLLTLLVPVTYMHETAAAEWIMVQLEQSMIAEALYDNNIILLIVGGAVR